MAEKTFQDVSLSQGLVTRTCILSTGSASELALWMRYVCSIYSVSRWRKLKGSLNITGMVILESLGSWKDGLGFCALIHRHRPELIDYGKLRKVCVLA